MRTESALLYCRVSTVDQKNSIENQEKRLREYCKKNNIVVAGVYIDFWKSGKNTKERPEFLRMMNLIQNSENPPASMVLCTKLDRFARSVLDLYQNTLIITEKGMRFQTLQQSFEISTPAGKLTLGVLGAVAEFEREIINERSREGFQAALKKGVICNRPRIDLPKKKILDLIEKGLSASSIAKFYGVHTNTIKSRLNEWGYWYDNGEWTQK